MATAIDIRRAADRAATKIDWLEETLVQKDFAQ